MILPEQARSCAYWPTDRVCCWPFTSLSALYLLLGPHEGGGFPRSHMQDCTSTTPTANTAMTRFIACIVDRLSPNTETPLLKPTHMVRSVKMGYVSLNGGRSCNQNLLIVDYTSDDDGGFSCLSSIVKFQRQLLTSMLKMSMPKLKITVRIGITALQLERAK